MCDMSLAIPLLEGTLSSLLLLSISSSATATAAAPSPACISSTEMQAATAAARKQTKVEQPARHCAVVVPLIPPIRRGALALEEAGEVADEEMDKIVSPQG